MRRTFNALAVSNVFLNRVFGKTYKVKETCEVNTFKMVYFVEYVCAFCLQVSHLVLPDAVSLVVELILVVAD